MKSPDTTDDSVPTVALNGKDIVLFPVHARSESCIEHLGLYRLGRKLGEGGMGTVYEAEQTEPIHRSVAIKIARATIESHEGLARFDLERKALAMMDHPNIARVFDAGTTSDGRPYFVMERIDGKSITRYCANQQIPLTERLLLVIDICRAVQHAHSKGIIHRDLKPSNVLVSLIDGKPTIKVIDFGIAKLTVTGLDQDLTMTGVVMGTPQYLSPEQLSGTHVDVRTDVYSIGVLLYEILTGTLPFESTSNNAADMVELFRQIREDDPSRPSCNIANKTSILQKRDLSWTDQLKGDLDWVIMKALAKDPNLRYATVADLAADLERFLRHEPVLARCPTFFYRIKKFVRRNRGFVAGVSMACLALVVGLGIATVEFFRANREADRARNAEAMALQRLEETLYQYQLRAEAEHKAQQEKDIALALAEFVRHDLLGLADVKRQLSENRPPNPNLTMREVLDRAGSKLETRFADRPLVEAAIRKTLGQAYLAVGQPKTAVEHLERALQLHIQHLGRPHSETIQTANLLAQMYRETGRIPDAEHLFQENVEQATQFLDRDHPDTLMTRFLQAEFWRHQGEVRKALAAFQEILLLRCERLGNDHPDVAFVMLKLAALYCDDYQYADAEPYAKQALRILESRLGLEHPDTIKALDTKGYVFSGLKQDGEAESLYKQAEELSVRVLGPDHPDTLRVITNRAIFLSGSNRTSEAEAIFDQVLPKFEQIVGPDSPLTRKALNHLVIAYQRQHKYKQADAIIHKLVEANRKDFGDTHTDTLTALQTLANQYRYTGKHKEAQAIYQNLRTFYIKKLGPNHSKTISITTGLALTHANLHQHAEAITLYRTILDYHQQTKGIDDPTTISVVNWLGVSLFEIRNIDEAQNCFSQVTALRSCLLGEDHPDTWTAMSNLAATYQKKHQYEEALGLYQSVLDARISKWGKEHIQVAHSIHNLGRTYYLQGDTAKALPLLQESLHLYRQIAPESKRDLLLACRNLAKCYDAMNQPANSIPLWEESCKRAEQLWGSDSPKTAEYRNSLEEAKNRSTRMDP